MLGGARSDEALVRRAQRGDRSAFDELVRRHRDRVYAVALRLTRDREEAEDALQEAFISAYRALPGFDARSRFSTWLHRIAVNACYDAIGRRRATVSLDAEGAFEPASPRDGFAEDATRTALVAALAALPDEFREAVVLCDVAGLGANEAGEVLGVPAGTVKSRVFRARALLATALREPDSPTVV